MLNDNVDKKLSELFQRSFDFFFVLQDGEQADVPGGAGGKNGKTWWSNFCWRESKEVRDARVPGGPTDSPHSHADLHLCHASFEAFLRELLHFTGQKVEQLVFNLENFPATSKNLLEIGQR